MTLAESVRDAADLYLSLEYPPPIFIYDSPCGFARHMECRAPAVTDVLWADKCGCFEKPELGKSPDVSAQLSGFTCRYALGGGEGGCMFNLTSNLPFEMD